MSAISVQDSKPSLNSRPAGLFTATTTPTGLRPAHTGTSRLEQLTDSSNNHTFTAVSVVNGGVQNLSQTLPRFFKPSFSILSSAKTTHPLTSALGALAVISIIMCSFILLYHPCRHNRPMRMDCKDAMARSEFLGPPTSRRGRRHRRRPLPSSTSTHVPGGRFIRARLTSRSRARSRSPSPEPRSDSTSSARITSRPRSSHRLAAGRTIQNPQEPRVLCPNYRTVHSKTSALCFKPDCEFERVNRCWRCCQCNRGPNRQSRCTSSAKKTGGEGAVLSKKCTHDVCSDCTKYVPIYISAVGDWIKPPAGTVTFDAVTNDGDTTESEDEEEEVLILDLMDLE